MQPIVGSTNTKIKAEIRVSLPTPTELQNFFESKAVELEYIQIYKSISESIDPENIARIRILFGDDLQLSEMKRILENFRRQNLTGADEIKKDSFQKIVNTLQEDISGFDKTFARNY